MQGGMEKARKPKNGGTKMTGAHSMKSNIFHGAARRGRGSDGDISEHEKLLLSPGTQSASPELTSTNGTPVHNLTSESMSPQVDPFSVTVGKSRRGARKGDTATGAVLASNRPRSSVHGHGHNDDDERGCLDVDGEQIHDPPNERPVENGAGVSVMHGSLGEEGLLDHSQQPFANRAAQSNDPARSRTWNGEKVPVDDAGWPTVGTGHEYDRGTGRSRVQADGDGDRKRQRARREELERENDGVELMVRDSLREQDGDSDLDDGDAGGGHGSGAGSGKCSNKRALINVLKSYIGSGVLGLPFAYSQGGMIAGTIGMLIVALLSTVAVFLLLDCKKRLGRHTRTFGDIGFGAAGRAGHSIVEGCVVLSQLGFCTAYIIFITQNMHRYMSAYFGEQEVTLTLIPALVLLCWIRSLQVLAPFSLLAIVLILAGLATVVLASADKIGLGKGVEPYVPDTLPVFIGMAIYSFEGIGLAVPIQNSMRQPEHFPFVWILASLIIAFVYVGFGALGYSCYGAEVPGIITMVLPDNLLSFVVKLGLCVSLLFTYPLAMFPIFEIVEESWLWRTLHPARRGAARDGETAVIEDGEDAAKLSVPRMRAVRVALVLVTVFAALVIPDFSVVMAFIGSVPCNIMAFVLPTFFHAVVCWDDMGFWGRARDCGLFLLGLLAVGNCTYATVRGIVSGTGPVGR